MFPAETLKSVEAQIVEKCDLLDGVKDGLMEDPRKCTIDVAALTGLSDVQRAALKKVYAETSALSAGSGQGHAIYPAQPVGGNLPRPLSGRPAGSRAGQGGDGPGKIRRAGERPAVGVARAPGQHW